MKTLANQTDEEEPSQRIRLKCPECEQMTTMRKMLARTDEGDEEDAGMSRMAAARCAKCDEEVNLGAPRGYRWAREVASAFSRRYGATLREGTLRHSNVAAAMTIR